METNEVDITLEDVELTGKEIPLSNDEVPFHRLPQPSGGVYYKNKLDSPTAHFKNLLRDSLLNPRPFLCLVMPDNTVVYTTSQGVLHKDLNPKYLTDGSKIGSFYPRTDIKAFDIVALGNNPLPDSVKTFFLSVWPKDVPNVELAIKWKDGSTEYTAHKKN